MSPRISTLEWALLYAQLGWPVLPWRAVDGQKVPFIKDWPRRATTNKKRICAWWQRWPDANVGILLGSRSGLAALDVDGPQGRERLANLTAEHGALLRTQVSRSRRGLRYLFGTPPDVVVRKKILGLQIELLGEGQWLAMPPSVHPSGKRYKWARGTSAHPAELPRWLIELASTGALPKAATPSDVAGEKVIPEHERNSTLTSLAGTMRKRGMSFEAIEAALLAENQERCQPPLQEKEVRRIARSVARYAPAETQLVQRFPRLSTVDGEEFEWENLPRFDPSKAPDTKWLYERLIPERAITFIVGDAGSYKSTYTLALCTAISQGEEFLGRETRKRRVLYLDNENPPDVLRMRNEAMGLGLEENERLCLWSLYEGRPLPKPGSRELREIVRRSVAQGRKPLIVFDHWASFLKPGEGGETTGQTSALLQEMKFLCGLGATILVLAHTKKYDPAMWYGGADILAKAHAMHTFVVMPDPLRPGGDIVQVKCFLKRHGGKDSFAFRPVPKNPSDMSSGVARFELVDDPVKVERRRKIEKLRDLIKHNPNLPQRGLARLATAFGLGRDEAEKLLKHGIGKYWEVKPGPKRKLAYVLVREENGPETQSPSGRTLSTRPLGDSRTGSPPKRFPRLAPRRFPRLRASR